MAGGSGLSIGSSQDFVIIADGGDKFAARIKAFTDAKKSVDDAYLQLKLGKDAKVEYERAKAAADKAASTVAEANIQANQILTDTTAQREQILAAASKYYSDKVAEADLLHAEAQARVAAATEVLTNAKKQAEVAVAQIAADKALIVQQKQELATKSAGVSDLLKQASATQVKYEKLIADIQSVTSRS